jgi:hypothetical protein
MKLEVGEFFVIIGEKKGERWKGKVLRAHSTNVS